MLFSCSDMMTGQAREEGFISAQFESRAHGDRTGFSHGTKQETEDTGGQAELYTSVTHFLQRGPLSQGSKTSQIALPAKAKSSKA